MEKLDAKGLEKSIEDLHHQVSLISLKAGMGISFKADGKATEGDYALNDAVLTLDSAVQELKALGLRIEALRDNVDEVGHLQKVLLNIQAGKEIPKASHIEGFSDDTLVKFSKSIIYGANLDLASGRDELVKRTVLVMQRDCLETMTYKDEELDGFDKEALLGFLENYWMVEEPEKLSKDDILALIADHVV